MNGWRVLDASCRPGYLLAEYSVHPTRIEVIHDGVDVSDFDVAAASDRGAGRRPASSCHAPLGGIPEIIRHGEKWE